MIPYLQRAPKALGWGSVLKRDIMNKLNYGATAPLYAERLWINPANVRALPIQGKEKLGDKRGSATVLEEWPVKSAGLLPLEELPKIAICVKRWVEKCSWEEAGAFSLYRRLCSSWQRPYEHEEWLARYRRLDAILEQVKGEGRLRTRPELDPSAFREELGIRINIGPGGELVFVDGGNHRLAIAYILQLDIIPAYVGTVHIGGLPVLHDLRRSPRP